MKKESIAEMYKDGEYAKNNPEFGDDNAVWKVKNALKAIKENDLKPEDIAEVGCGAGKILLSVAEEIGAKKGLGYEPMPEAYAVASSRTTDQVKFVNDSVDENTVADHDLMLCFDVFEHIEDYFKFLRNLQGTAKNFLFHIPLDMNANLVVRESQLMAVRKQVGHIHYFSRASALAALRDCGYEVKDEFYTSAAESAHTGGWKGKVLGVFRKIGYKISKNFTVRLLGGYSLMVYATPQSK